VVSLTANGAAKVLKPGAETKKIKFPVTGLDEMHAMLTQGWSARVGGDGRGESMSLRRSVAGALWMLLLVVPTWAQSVEIKCDPNNDFRGYKTYAWQERKLLTRQAKENEQLIDQALVDAFNTQLKAKGLTENPSAPDFYLTYRGGSIIGDAKSGQAYTPGDLAGWGVQGTWTSNTIPGSVPNVWVSMRGVLLVEVTDAKTKTVVWSNILRKKIKNPGKMPKDIDKTATAIAKKALQDFPPGANRK